MISSRKSFERKRKKKESTVMWLNMKEKVVRQPEAHSSSSSCSSPQRGKQIRQRRRKEKEKKNITRLGETWMLRKESNII